ncbi:enoyl-CoA hydratase/isomerase family protein [Pseudonocardia spinosispora]|uniref:enoyl-CoA hydratase/isomerase family protein n=1 Tax=Pseudonocardia spinosispora TaxID=103441 RepID=UPI0003FD6C03|nr:enoyl-CoA hydratase/isomerase family protein [Pseudonocardia spinosispora]
MITITTPGDGRLIEVELNAPPGNLLTVAACVELAALLRHPPSGAHVLRLRGAGGAFCLGRERAATTPAELRAETATLVELHRAVRDSPLVTVASVHGDAAGFGVGLVAMCDVAVAASQARFSFPEVDINLAPALGLAWLPRLVGEREAFWMTATGAPIDADRARALDLLNDVVPPADLDSEVDRRIQTLLAGPPRIHAEIKDMLRAMRSLDDDQALETSIDRLAVAALRRAD